MILDLRELAPDLLAPNPEGITVTAVADDEGIGHSLFLEAAIWGAQADTSRAFLRTTLEDRFQGHRAFIAYSREKPIGFGRVTVSQGSQFAGLWGGSVLPEFRGRGIYRALRAARSNMQGDSIRFVILKLMQYPLAGRSWRDTDSRGWVPPGRRIRRQRTGE
jgi:hypothetical protein